MNPFLIIGHRGAAGHAPENTMPAFARADALGVVHVELDVMRSRDGVLVLFHDRTLDEKTGRAGTVRDWSAEELLGMDLGPWFARAHPEASVALGDVDARIIRLETLFERYGARFVYHLEIKADDPEIPGELHAMVERFGLADRVMITSFRYAALERFRELAPSYPTCLLAADAAGLARRAGPGHVLLDLQKAEIDRAVERGFAMVGFAAQDLSAELVAHARAQGILIRAWRIRTDDHLRRAFDLGTNGMTIDWPERAIRLRLEADSVH